LNKKFVLCPSILSADFTKLGEQIGIIEKYDDVFLHYDVMDGHFVPEISFGTPVLRSLRKNTDMFIDVHLMVEEPEKMIEQYALAGADLITVHEEAKGDMIEISKKIKSFGKQSGISIKPKTPVSEAEKYLEYYDQILIMTVEPGYGGQGLIPETLDKVKEVKALADLKYPHLSIQTDGGVTVSNIRKVYEAGSDRIVAGTAVFKGSIKDNLEKLKGEVAHGSDC